MSAIITVKPHRTLITWPALPTDDDLVERVEVARLGLRAPVVEVRVAWNGLVPMDDLGRVCTTAGMVANSLGVTAFVTTPRELEITEAGVVFALELLTKASKPSPPVDPLGERVRT